MTDETVQRRCEVCGAELTTQEMTDAIESGGPFLCQVHAAEELPEIGEEPPPVA